MTYRLPIIIFTSLFLTIFGLAIPAQAQNEGRWYTVELIIFKNLNGVYQSREIWPNSVELKYPDNYRYLSNNPNADFGLLPRNQHALGNYRFALQQSENYEILFHRAWQQQMQNVKDAPAIVINGGQTINGVPELSGTITIHIARYLHVVSNLWLSHFIAEDEQPTWPIVPDPPESTPFAWQYAEQGSTTPIATMRSHRKMRSKELHYIDHPLMGILVLFTPIDELGVTPE